MRGFASLPQMPAATLSEKYVSTFWRQSHRLLQLCTPFKTSPNKLKPRSRDLKRNCSWFVFFFSLYLPLYRAIWCHHIYDFVSTSTTFSLDSMLHVGYLIPKQFETFERHYPHSRSLVKFIILSLPPAVVCSLTPATAPHFQQTKTSILLQYGVDLHF